MSRALLVTLPGGGPGRGSSCEDCPFRAWDYLVERGDLGATSRTRELCNNPAFEAEGQVRSLDAGRLPECIAAEETASQLADVLGAARAWATADAQDALDEEGSPNLGEARRALHLAVHRAEGVIGEAMRALYMAVHRAEGSPARDGAIVPVPSVPGIETIADVRRERAQALADLGDALAALKALVTLAIEDRMEIGWTSDEFVRHPEITEAYEASARARSRRKPVDVAPILRRALEILRRAGR